MVRTPQSPRRLAARTIALLALIVLAGSACSATPSWIPVDEAAATSVADPNPALDAEAVSTGEQPPAELAFVEEDADPVPSASEGLCTASANIWLHSAALNILGDEATPEMTQIAMANVAEWIERSTLLTEIDSVMAERREMFDAFTALQAMVANDFASDWSALQASTAYANDPAAQLYEAARSELVTFLAAECPTLSLVDLRADADARAQELIADFGADPSTVVESDSLPGHSIFTHTSGRLIASFPSSWAHEEGRGDAIVDLIAAPDIERFLAGDAVDGVRLQLMEAASLDVFRELLSATATATSCERTNDLVDTGVTRMNITQTFACSDHGASVIGQYNDDVGLGLIIEASFDRPEASRADLIRLASIANSALWS